MEPATTMQSLRIKDKRNTTAYSLAENEVSGTERGPYTGPMDVRSRWQAVNLA